MNNLDLKGLELNGNTNEWKMMDSLEFFKSIIAAIREPILILNSDLKCFFANKSFTQIFNVDPTDIIDKSIYSIGNGLLNIQGLKDLLDELLSIHRDFEEYEVNLNLVDIGRRSMSLNATDVIQTTNKERLILLSFEDITERRIAEMLLLENEKKYRTLFESSRDAIMMLAPPNWSFTEGNTTTIKMFRCKDENDFTSRHPWELSPELQHDGQLSPIKAREMIRKAVVSGSNFFEWTHMRADGEIFPATVLLSRIELNGRVLLQATVRDITERKQVEEELRTHRFHLKELVLDRTMELRESEEKYRTLVEQSHDGIFIYSGNRFRFVNDQMCDFIGRTKEELCNLEYTELIHPEDRHRILGYERKRKEGKEVPNIYQFRIVRDVEEVRYIEFSIRHITYHGEYAVLGVCRDITALKKLEEEQNKIQKLESLGILAGGIAHDFNNFLTAIMGNISLARMMVEPGSDIYEILTSSEHAASKASSLTNQLLTFSRGGEPVKALTSIDILLRESAIFALSGSNVTAEFDIQDDLWLAVVDRGQIEQVINNIIINADQAMPEGGKTLISAENIEIGENGDIPLDSGNYIKIVIEDEGTGIPEEQLSRIFDPFFSTKQTGSGLGLATAYSIVKKHLGHITVESKFGSGSAFIMYLPSETAIEDDTQLEVSFSSICEGKILVMDDMEIILNTAKGLLENLGYTVECASEGSEAFEKYSSAMENGNPFNAVILDLTIPNGMGGRDTIKELRMIDPNVRAIVSSGYSNDPVMAEYESFGFSGFVLKPYSMKQLASVLEKILKS